jgi:hypothetical protein
VRVQRFDGCQAQSLRPVSRSAQRRRAGVARGLLQCRDLLCERPVTAICAVIGGRRPAKEAPSEGASFIPSTHMS